MTTSSYGPLFHLTRHGDAVTARVLCPTLTEADAAALDREFAALLAGRDRPAVTLDLAALRFLGSMVVGRLVGLSHAVRAAGGRLTLVNLAPHLRVVFTVCRVGGLLDPGGAGRAGPSAATRALAYRKWEEAGRPRGDGVAFWYSAERELAAGGGRVGSPS